jgi:hypothetical protein
MDPIAQEARFITSVERSIRGGGGRDKVVKLAEDQRKDFLEVIDNKIKDFWRQEDIAETPQEVRMDQCSNMGEYVPCDPNVPGECPSADLFLPGAPLSKQVYSKWYEFDTKTRRRRRCIPKALLNTGNVPATYRDSSATAGDDTMNTRLFKFWKGLGMIRKSWDESLIFNRALIQDPRAYQESRTGSDGKQEGGMLRASKCNAGKKSREACEILMTPREQGARYAERCFWDPNNTTEPCAPKRLGTRVYRDLTAGDIARIRATNPSKDIKPSIMSYRYDIDSESWEPNRAAGSVTYATVPSDSNIKGNDMHLKGPFGNTRQQVMPGDVHSIALAMFRRASTDGTDPHAGLNNGDRFVDNNVLMRVWNAVIDKQTIAGGAPVFGDIDKRLTDGKAMIKELARGSYSYYTAQPTKTAALKAFGEGSPNDRLFHAAYMGDRGYMLELGRVSSTATLYKYMLQTMLRHHLRNPLKVMYLPPDVQADIANALMQHVSYVRYLPALADGAQITDCPDRTASILAGMSPKDRADASGASGQAYQADATRREDVASSRHQAITSDATRQHSLNFGFGKGQVDDKRVDGFRYIHIFADRTGTARATATGVAMEAADGATHGYDFHDYADVVRELFKSYTVDQIVAMAFHAIDRHWSEVSKSLARSGAVTVSSGADMGDTWKDGAGHRRSTDARHQRSVKHTTGYANLGNVATFT